MAILDLAFIDINFFYLQGKRNKKFFWLPAIAPLISVILSTLIVYLTKADKHGVNIVKHIKGGLNPSSAHQLQLRGPHVGQAAKAGLISAVIALAVSSLHCFLYIFNLDQVVDPIKILKLSEFG